MKKLFLIALIVSVLSLPLAATTADAHSGRTDKNGCHKEKATGKRHCH